MSLITWLLCGVFTLSISLTYLELALLLDKAGGPYLFCLETFGPTYGRYLAFLCSWSGIVISAPSAVVLMIYTATQYCEFLQK